MSALRQNFAYSLPSPDVDTPDDSAFREELALEEEMVTTGIDRFWKLVGEADAEGQSTADAAVRRQMKAALVPTLAGIKGFLEAASAGRAGRKHTAVALIKDVEPEVLTYITVKTTLDRIHKPTAAQHLALMIGKAIEAEIKYREFREENPRLFAHFLGKLEASSHHEGYKRRVLTFQANRHVEGGGADWSNSDAVLVGSKLLELFVQATGMVYLQDRKDRRATTVVLPSPALVSWISEERNRREALLPCYLPTIIPPKPWTSTRGGGYWSPRINLQLVKARLGGGRLRAYLNELENNADLSKVYKAVNALQGTAWAINRRVYEVLDGLWAAGSTVGDLPLIDDAPIPKRPADIPDGIKAADMPEDMQARFKAWKQAATATYEQNATMRGKRLAVARMLDIAERYKDREEFYFPYTVDFRGRIYPVPMLLNPQGNDVARGLLEFANAVPITDEEGARWLAIHGAGLWGVDKVSMSERVAWVEANTSAILASAADPFANRFWSEAEKPFQALAFCFDWAGFKAEGYEYASCLPIQMDGTCNGLQNFSAMLRDEVGGRAVNLVPGEKPSDIYQVVADLVIEEVERVASSDARSDAELLEALEEARKAEDKEAAKAATDIIAARGWRGRVTRKVTKRPVMTLAYGAKRYGFSEQVMEDTVRPMQAAGGDFPWPENLAWAAAQWMGGVIWDCVGDVVIAARGAMDWLQASAKTVTKAALPVRWTTPAGFVVVQDYRKQRGKRMDITFNKVRVQWVIEEDAPELDVNRMASSIAPNFVHSLDASHLMLTVGAAAEAGIRSLSMIHDSYGTHAGNTWALAQMLREEFVKMYSADILGGLKSELEDQLPEGEQLTRRPPFGSLDLNQIHESAFFFA